MAWWGGLRLGASDVLLLGRGGGYMDVHFIIIKLCLSILFTFMHVFKCFLDIIIKRSLVFLREQIQSSLMSSGLSVLVGT